MTLTFSNGEIFLHAICLVAPFLLLGLLTFGDHLRFSFKMTVPLTMLLLGIRTGFEFIVLYGPQELYPLAEIISGAMYAAFLLILVKDKPGKLFFFLLAASSYSSTLVLLAKNLEWRWFPEYAGDRYRFTYSLILLGCELVGLLVPYFLFFRSFGHVKLLPKIEKNWSYLWLIPLIFYVIWMNLFYGGTIPAFQQAQDFYPVALKLTLDFGSLMMYQIVLRMMRDETDNLVQQAQLRAQDRALSDLHNLDLRIAEARQLRHDAKHHLLSLRAILKNEGAEGAARYIDNLEQNHFLRVPLSFCENPLGNAILQHYYALASMKGIQFDAKVSLSKKSIFTDTEFAVTMGNLLANALEAAALCEPGERFMEIRSRATTSSIYSIRVRNSYVDPPRRDARGNYLSRHHEGLGIGLQSVQATVDKYHGTMLINEEDNIFQVAITLYKPPEETDPFE